VSLFGVLLKEELKNWKTMMKNPLLAHIIRKNGLLLPVYEPNKPKKENLKKT